MKSTPLELWFYLCHPGLSSGNLLEIQFLLYRYLSSIAILNKQKYLLKKKNGRQEGKTGPVWGLVPVNVERI
jgi:hypothetical protein